MHIKAICAELAKILALIALAVLLVFNSAVAQMPGGNSVGDISQKFMRLLPEAARTASYSADRIMEVGGQIVEGRVYRSGMNERTDIMSHGMTISSIMRMDRNEIYSLMPAQRMYMIIPLGTTDAIGDVNFELINKGRREIDGVETTHYHLPPYETPDGIVESHYYITERGAPILIEVKFKSGRENTEMTMRLSNVTYGPQDDALFEVPPGYQSLAVPGGFNPRMMKPGG